MVKVYVAGAYSDTDVLRVLKNIGRGEHYASILFKKGFAPFTPWHDKTFVINNWKDNFSVEEFYDYSMEWLKVSDCVYVVPNHEGMKNWEDSVGIAKEIEVAESLGIPVFYEFQDLLDFKTEQTLIVDENI